MSETQSNKIMHRLARIYGGGILVFCAIVGTLTLLGLLLVNLNFP